MQFGMLMKHDADSLLGVSICAFPDVLVLDEVSNIKLHRVCPSAFGFSVFESIWTPRALLCGPPGDVLDRFQH